MSVRLSPDGMYYWDGQSWVSTLSHDGRSRWNGVAWVTLPGATPQATAAAPGGRVPTTWTRPLQLAVAGWYVWSALYVLTIPFWMGGLMSQLVNESLQRQQARNPSATLPPDFIATMDSLMTVTLWVVVVLTLALCAVAIIGALRRWTWVYYAVLVLLGLGALFLPLDLVDAAAAPSLNPSAVPSLPVWYYLLGFVTGLPGAALFAGMLVAQVRFGPWGMKPVS